MTTQEANLHCPKCAIFAVHEIILEHSDSRDEEFQSKESPPIWVPVEDVYRIVRCKNCNTVSGQSLFLIQGEFQSENHLIPNSTRALPSWARKLPPDIYSTLIEVYNALRSNSHRLAVIGCRTLIDMSSNRKVGDIGGFDAKIKELHKIGLLSDSTRFILNHAIEAGNASAHRGWQPTPKESDLVLDIVEHFLHADVLAVEASEFGKSVPKKTWGRE
jgi:hypothetical protein